MKMNNKTVEVITLDNTLLDYFVGVADNQHPVYYKGFAHVEIPNITFRSLVHNQGYKLYRPTRNWAIAGPIIEREKIAIYYRGTLSVIDDSGAHTKDVWVAECNMPYQDPAEQTHSTLLTAAMRCFVISKLGTHVELPQEHKDEH
jgi:hypothetical protein